jgi:hypothetical protein
VAAELPRIACWMLSVRGHRFASLRTTAYGFVYPKHGQRAAA